MSSQQKVAQIVTGYDISFPVQLEIKSDNTGYLPFNMSGKVAKARIVTKDHSKRLTQDVVLSELAAGADWSTSLVVVQFSSADTQAISYQGEAIVEIQVEMPEKKPFFVSATVVTGHPG